jgi:DNA-binding XRE family transcriptional regulator
MKYHHTNAGTVSIINGVRISDNGVGERAEIHLYQVGTEIHEIRGDLPQGAVDVEPYNQPIEGWGLKGPLVKVVTPSGSCVVVPKYDIDQIKFSTRIRSLRLRLGLTQAKAGEVMGVTKSTIEKWEREDRKPHQLSQKAALDHLRNYRKP